MKNRSKIYPHLDDALIQRFKSYCAAKGVTESSVVEAALKNHLDGTADSALLMRRLNRLGRSVERVERDVGILAEAFGLFVQLWLAHTPEIPGDQKDLARRVAASRYQRFLDHVAAQVTGGRRFIDRFVPEELTELEAPLAAPAAAPSRDAAAPQEATP